MFFNCFFEKTVRTLKIGETAIFYVNLESSCLCLIQRTLGELPDFEVMIWQLCHLQRFALICFSSNSFLPTKIINLIVFSIMS